MGYPILTEIRRSRVRLKKVLDRLLPVILSIAVFLAVAILASLLLTVIISGGHRLSWNLITNYPSANPNEAGMRSAILGSIYTVGLSTLICIPISMATAIYLVEYSRGGKLSSILSYNISNLAGVPSIIFGVVGLGFLAYWLGMGRTIITGAFTLAILTLPLVTVTSVEALKAIPDDLRHGAYALGATTFQVVRYVVLPRALPMMLTGGILGISRALGEAAPILVVSGLIFIREDPTSLFSKFTVIPLQLYNWISRPQQAFIELSSAGIIILLLVLLILNGIVIGLRYFLIKRAGQL
ncbi:MAG: phosphate ABC transporter permease PstA [Aigarchaeota archaeon]|nr:phosphate ABC transporter permease PstA [Aigarchaeota archaeon]MCX8192332.1 phosphate ABC transporter permease PstA [Nitrososphaeria archaeon]MDW7986856.1 phosphate ABC transporter permease PstA [Nitrososphaerota archaeon]